MRRLVASSIAAVMVSAAMVVGFLADSNGSVTVAANAGPQIVVGAPSLVSGKVNVPISTAGSGFSPYKGFNLHLRWDPSVFTFSSANSTGTVINSPFCPPAVADGDGAGAVFACTGLGAATTGTGLLATFVLTPATGCSPLHLFTLGAPDGGTLGSGTYTSDPTAQTNTYQDGTANASGSTCSVPGTATPTPTATNTLSPTSTPTFTATPTATLTPLVGYPDVTVSVLSVPTHGDSASTVSYSIVVSNGGTVSASGVHVAVTIPPGAVPFKNAQCKTYVGGDFICDLPNLGSGMQEGAILNMQVATTSASIVMAVHVHVSATNEPPANQGNNDGQTNTAVTGCPDLDGDNQISIIDFAIAASSFGLSQGQPGYNPLADQDGDHTITIVDFNIMATRYLQTCKGFDGDHDGLSDYDEVNLYHTDPMLADSDGDGLPDGVEVLTYGSNPLQADTDGDGYTDGVEAAMGKDPTTYCQIMAADLDHDGMVAINDFSISVLSWLLSSGNPGFNPAADIDHDGTVNIIDLTLMAQHFLQSVNACP